MSVIEKDKTYWEEREILNKGTNYAFYYYSKKLRNNMKKAHYIPENCEWAFLRYTEIIYLVCEHNDFNKWPTYA